MCREEVSIGQTAKVEDDGGEDDDDDEEGGGADPPAAALAASEWLVGPYMEAWLASLENSLKEMKRVADSILCLERLSA